MTRIQCTSHFRICITSLILLVSNNLTASRTVDGVCNVTSSFIPRQQGRDRARQMVGLMHHLYFDNDDGCNYGTFSWIAEYTRSFRPQRLADCLFGADLTTQGFKANTNNGCCDNRCDNDCDRRCVLIQGSEVENRNPCAWLADNFYLPASFNGSFCVEPRIQNFLWEFDYFLGLDAWLCGLYFRIWGPLTWTKWDLNFCESSETGTVGYDEGYFGPNEIAAENLLGSFEAYSSGCAPANIPSDGIVFNGLRFARFSSDSQSRFGFANVRTELGWNIYNSSCHHLGIYVQAAAPTGNTKKACQLFQPIVGNGHHWEFGAGIHGHRQLYECDNTTIGFYFDAYATHLFGSKQQRTLDLCGKPNSRYMLAMRVEQPIEFFLSGAAQSASIDPANPLAANAQFKGEYTPVANLTTVNVNVNYAAEAEVTALFNFAWCAWSLDLGYNFWVRSCTKFDCLKACDQFNCGPNICDPSQTDRWVLKGDARVFGYTNAEDERLPDNVPVPLSSSQSQATIRTGTNATNEGTNAGLLNLGINNPLFAYAGLDENNLQRLVYGRNIADDEANHIRTSIQPVFIKCQDLNFQSIRGISHKVFGHLSYNWCDCDCWIPFLGIGGFAEFGRTESCCQDACKKATPSVGITSSEPCCEPLICADAGCFDCALSQWGIWLKGGVSW